MKRNLSVSVVFLFLGALAACDKKGGPLGVDHVDPPQGVNGGGDHVTIYGSGFEPGKTQVEIRFGRRKAEQVSIASVSTISVVTPPGDPGPTDVTLMFDSGETHRIANGFRYIAPQTTDDVRKAFFSGGPGAKK